MSLFAIPEGLIEDLHTVAARFWWGSKEGERKLHWWSWEKMCQPKSLGGMGFRDMRIFNQALLAKQVWRLLVRPESLVCRILKAKYFKHGSILDARRGFDPSFTWRSLWNAKSLLMDGLRWRVGDGRNIKVWEDAWVPGSEGTRFLAPNIEANPEMLVEELIDRENGGWKASLLNDLFTSEEVKAIMSIPLSRAG
ncbi:putative mitochondrial protein AtMg00310 [Silene latifolia]|uniref:putative mitochondrial protein AtMg00310 n=1 Tax=Silene latifolia TaxID=37657 RepID=UPI003D78A8DA